MLAPGGNEPGHRVSVPRDLDLYAFFDFIEDGQEVGFQFYRGYLSGHLVRLANMVSIPNDVAQGPFSHAALAKVDLKETNVYSDKT